MKLHDGMFKAEPRWAREESVDAAIADQSARVLESERDGDLVDNGDVEETYPPIVGPEKDGCLSEFIEVVKKNPQIWKRHNKRLWRIDALTDGYVLVHRARGRAML